MRTCFNNKEYWEFIFITQILYKIRYNFDLCNIENENLQSTALLSLIHVYKFILYG